MARKKGDIVMQINQTNAPQIIKDALKSRGYTQLMLAEKLGYHSQSAIAKALGGRNLQINSMVAILDTLGFDIIIKDRNSNNRENVWKIVPIQVSTEESEGDDE